MILAPICFAAAPAHAQAAVEPCGDCLGIRSELRVGDDAGPGRLDRGLASWARDSRGRIYVSGGSFGKLRVFGADGRFLRILPERAPSDTAEWVPGLVAITPGDTVHLVDDLSGQHQVLDPSFRPVRTLTVSPFLRASAMMLVLPGDTLFGSGTVATRDGIGYPLHFLSPKGDVVRSFGTDSPDVSPSAPPSLRKLAPAGAGRFWAGELTRYRVERWTADGRRDAVIEREVPWFPAYARMGQQRGEAPKPLLMAVRQDSAGRLWTVVRVADPRWSEARAAPVDSSLARRSPLAPYDLNQIYDTVVEVFAPGCTRPAASQRFPQLFAGFLDDRHLVEWRVLNANAPARLGVWRIELNIPPAGEHPCNASS
ncbi:MAG TPA: hypothetical protein VE913_21315 [Longimicrobium sp.]|nr:hypothetical protein [Longimicrobium sp.]